MSFLSLSPTCWVVLFSKSFFPWNLPIEYLSAVLFKSEKPNFTFVCEPNFKGLRSYSWHSKETSRDVVNVPAGLRRETAVSLRALQRIFNMLISQWWGRVEQNFYILDLLKEVSCVEVWLPLIYYVMLKELMQQLIFACTTFLPSPIQWCWNNRKCLAS